MTDVLFFLTLCVLHILTSKPQTQERKKFTCMYLRAVHFISFQQLAESLEQDGLLDREISAGGQPELMDMLPALIRLFGLIALPW